MPAQNIEEHHRHVEHVDGTMMTNPPVFILIYSAALVLILSAAQHTHHRGAMA